MRAKGLARVGWPSLPRRASMGVCRGWHGVQRRPGCLRRLRCPPVARTARHRVPAWRLRPFEHAARHRARVGRVSLSGSLSRRGTCRMRAYIYTHARLSSLVGRLADCPSPMPSSTVWCPLAGAEGAPGRLSAALAALGAHGARPIHVLVQKFAAKFGTSTRPTPVIGGLVPPQRRKRRQPARVHLEEHAVEVRNASTSARWDPLSTQGGACAETWGSGGAPGGGGPRGTSPHSPR